MHSTLSSTKISLNYPQYTPSNGKSSIQSDNCLISSPSPIIAQRSQSRICPTFHPARKFVILIRIRECFKNFYTS
ncbi:hypothetical protein ACN42_g5155 [Penicillium freii]|uniref:Uncharacterized protein n=1 Tax=Penicillium freii TaxID=48697 RepID=A0A124GRP8_PENFR|nr:hypothetical protein ACN42_g5155 [Penicillium freii]